MKILMLSIDSKIFDEDSPVYQKMKDYGKLVDELHVVVYTKARAGIGEIELAKTQLSSNVFAYPTNTKKRPMYFIDAYRICAKILKKKRREFKITSQEAMTNMLAVVLKVRFSLPLQIQIHTDFMSPYFKEESLKNRLRYFGYFLGVKYANRIRVVSKRIKSSLVDKYNIPITKIDVLPVYTNIKKLSTRRQGLRVDLKEKYPQFDFIVLMASRIEVEKNISLAIKSFENVVKKYPRSGLVIVGSGGKKKELKTEVFKAGLEENVIFEDWSNDLISYYKTADLFLLSSNYEGYGLTLIEAAVVGCPILTTDVGLVGDIINKNNALVCDVGDLRCVSRSMLNAIENKSMLRLLSSGANKAVAEYSKTSGRYMDDYKASWDRTT